MEMARDLLKGETMSDIFVLQAFEAYAKACITYFRNKDKNDTLQEEHMAECVAIGYLPPIIESDANVDTDANDDSNDGDDNDHATHDHAMNESSKRKLEILLSFDKHKSHTPTLDTYVIKMSPSAASAAAPIIPKHREINLDDPKFKTKDIKPKKNGPNGPNGPNGST
jgi:hypothetical protein